MNRNSQLKQFRDTLHSNKIHVPFILAVLGNNSFNIILRIDKKGHHSLVMNDERESLHVDSSLPFKLLNDNHVLEAIGLTHCTQDEVVKYLPQKNQDDMIKILDL